MMPCCAAFLGRVTRVLATSAATPVLVAYTQDDVPLDRPRLVVPGDIEGSRYVSRLVELRVVDLAGIAPGDDGVPADGDGYHASQR
jgi:hypothetical protein